LILDRNDIVADMHAAYDRIATLEAASSTGSSAASVSYGFATFIAGPSKTADIEQSLVLGAHGPLSMTVFLLDTAISDAGFY
jgi:L-lactate dehydrogenase complex protein LldG